MSAPTTHDPLVINTRDGSVWMRRAVTRDGHGLYAVADSVNCPEYVMATLAELAEHGIVGQAHALPMPVGPAPTDLPRDGGQLRKALQDTLAALLAGQVEREALQRENEQLRGMAGRQYERRIATARTAARYRAAWHSARRRARARGSEVAQKRRQITELVQQRDRIVNDVAAALATEAPGVATLTIYRAEHPDSGITLGHYATAAAARAHCEALMRRDFPGASLDWIEDEEDGVAELVAAVGEDEQPTGYAVVALELDSEYDEEADE